MSRILVIGGGVVGISCALELLDDGHSVTVLDHGVPGEGASWASCGSIAVSEVIPLSKPRSLMHAPKWLMDPTGPLTLRAASAVAILPWFLQFVTNSRMSRIKEISEQLSTLTSQALLDTESFLARLGLSGLIGETPVIEVYDRHKDLAKERRFHDMRRALGFTIDEISGAEALEMEPSLSTGIACAALFRDWRSVVDAKRYVVALHEAFAARGGGVDRRGAVGFVRDGASVTGAPPNWRRAEVLVEKAKRLLPGLRTAPAQRRMGRRPLTPDTKPIIGRAPKAPNVIFATGHGQLGLTLAATTGRLVRDIAAFRTPEIDLSGFRPDRF